MKGGSDCGSVCLVRYSICTVLARCHVIEVKHSNKNKDGSNHVLGVISLNLCIANLLLVMSDRIYIAQEKEICWGSEIEDCDWSALCVTHSPAEGTTLSDNWPNKPHSCIQPSLFSFSQSSFLPT